MADEELAATEETPEVELEDAPAAPTEDTAAETTDETEEPKAEEPPEEKPRKRRGFQKRIDKLTTQVREQERLIAELQTPKDAPLSEPKRDDFDDYEKYIDARADYKAEQRLEQDRKTRQEQSQQSQQREVAAAFEEARETVIESGIDAYKDFEDVAMSGDLQISQTMAEGLLQSETGHDVWYHLGKNPAKAEKISSLPPAKQLLELGRLEASLKSAKKPSNAPKPTKSVGSRGTANNGPADSSDLKTWMEKRNRQVHG